MPDFPGGVIWIESRAPSFSGPLIDRMNGFQSGIA
jgi:hypothetical protein